MRRFLAQTALALGFLAASAAQAATATGTYVPSGSTTGSGPWTMTSTDATYSELDFVLTTQVPFSQLSSIVVDYNAVLGGIGGGAPRLYVVVDTNNDTFGDKYFQIQFGPAGSYVDPTLGPATTGNLLSFTEVGRYDLATGGSAIGGSGYTDRAAALAAAGSFNVVELDLVIDSFGGNDRNFIINSITVETVSAVPEPAEWAMMLAGLGLVTGLARRRAAAKAA